MRARAFALVLAAGLAGCGHIQIVPKDVARGPVVPEISNTLLALIDAQERGVISAADYRSTSLGAIAALGTPAGFRLRLRYQELGVSLVEALKMSRDENLLARLLELAQWSQGRRVRSEALVTLGAFGDPKDLRYFEAALRDQDVGIRFAAVEAVQRWGREGSAEFLREAMRDPWSPLMRVFAAQAALSLGDADGLAVLFSALEDRSWIVRALAARYLGDHARPEDHDVLLRALNRETRNDFVVAELGIATLKLVARRDDAGAARPPERAGAANAQVPATPDDVIEMEPLVLRPPRLRIPESVRVAQVINEKLVRLVRDRLNLPKDPALEADGNYQDMNRLVTPAGFALQTRYSELSVAVAEGLAGTTDPFLRAELRRLAEANRNPVTRATALVSLAYSRADEDIPLISAALSDPDPVIRFGAMEAAQVGRFREVGSSLLGAVSGDPVPAFRMFALQVLLSFDDPTAYTTLITSTGDSDWPARAMSFWYLGRYGRGSDYSFVLNAIAREKNPFVLAEAVLAAQRLAPR